MKQSTKVIGSGVGGAIAAIIAAVFTLEGGYVNNPRDPGGETNHGVTKQVAVEHGYTGSMKDLTKETAADIYYQSYILKPSFHRIVELSPAVGEKLVDAGVNTGPARPSRWFQIAVNSLNRDGQDYRATGVDGILGNDSVRAYKDLQRVRGKVKACEMTLKLLDAQQANYYMSLGHLKTFTPGWIDHRIGNVPISRCSDER